MKVREVMRTDVTTVSLDDIIAKAAMLMREANSDYLVTFSESGLNGVLTVENLVYDCMVEGHDPWECLVIRHVTPVTESAHPNMEVGDAAIVMMDHILEQLPVVDEERLVGIMLREDLILALEQTMITEAAAMSGDRWR